MRLNYKVANVADEGVTILLDLKLLNFLENVEKQMRKSCVKSPAVSNDRG